MRVAPFQKLVRFIVLLSVVSLPLVTNARLNQQGSWCVPLSSAVTVASRCVWGLDCESPLPKPDLTRLPAWSPSLDASRGWRAPT